MNSQTFARLGKRVSTFVGAQSAVQLLNAATGLLLLRMMPKPEFAVYAVVLGIQGMIAILTDLGFGGAIPGLVGTRYADKKLLGTYIRTASFLRQSLLLFLIAIAIASFLIFRHGLIGALGREQAVFLAIAVLVTVQFQAWASYYEVPLLLNNRLVSYYSPQLAAAALRLAASLALFYTHIISSTSMILANTLSIVIMGFSYRLMARQWIEVPRTLSKRHAVEMIRYLVPLIPGSLYQALQSQISLFLITFFGHVSQIAEVAAAGRIGQLFLLLNSSNGVLVTPFFAKTPRSSFARRYALAMCTVCAVALVVAASARFLPALYLILLGATYSNLAPQVQLVVYASAIGYLAGAMWSIAVARKWIFWWSGSLQLVLLTLIQIACIRFLPLDTSEGVLKMNIFTACGALTVQILHLAQGLSVHSRIEPAEAVAT